MSDAPVDASRAIDAAARVDQFFMYLVWFLQGITEVDRAHVVEAAQEAESAGALIAERRIATDGNEEIFLILTDLQSDDRDRWAEVLVWAGRHGSPWFRDLKGLSPLKDRFIFVFVAGSLELIPQSELGDFLAAAVDANGYHPNAQDVFLVAVRPEDAVVHCFPKQTST